MANLDVDKLSGIVKPGFRALVFQRKIGRGRATCDLSGVLESSRVPVSEKERRGEEGEEDESEEAERVDVYWCLEREPEPNEDLRAVAGVSRSSRNADASKIPDQSRQVLVKRDGR